MANKTSAEVFTAFAVGIGIGAVMGILFAPQSGEDTRDYLLSGVRNQVDDAVSTGKRYVQRAQEGAEQVRGQVRSAVETGKEYARRAQESVGDLKDQAKEQVKTQVANAADSVDRTYHQVNEAASAADRAYHKTKGA